jgi:transcription elongation factor Elf1
VKKWEKYKDSIISYINTHPNARISEIIDEIGCSRYTVTLVSTKFDLWKNLSHDNNLAKNRETRLKKYGDENFNNKEKARQTCLDKYGGIGFASKELKEKYEHTMLDRYGVKHNWSSEDSKLNGKDTCFKKYNGKENFYTHTLSKGKQTKLDKYGDMYYSNHKKASSTMLKKYGSPYFVTTQKCRENLYRKSTKIKRYETMKKNNSFNISKPEEDYYQYLLTQYEKDDIIRQYRSEEYPFNCDFYIISEDLFIECNYSWTHGFKQFDENNKKDLELLSMWKSKSNGNDYYANAIYTWTDLDVRKRKIAKENNLNIKFIY